MGYLVKEIIDAKISRENGEETRVYRVKMVDEITEEKCNMTLSKAPKYAAGDVLEITQTKKQTRLTESGEKHG